MHHFDAISQKNSGGGPRTPTCGRGWPPPPPSPFRRFTPQWSLRLHWSLVPPPAVEVLDPPLIIHIKFIYLQAKTPMAYIIEVFAPSKAYVTILSCLPLVSIASFDSVFSLLVQDVSYTLICYLRVIYYFLSENAYSSALCTAFPANHRFILSIIWSCLPLIRNYRLALP